MRICIYNENTVFLPIYMQNGITSGDSSMPLNYNLFFKYNYTFYNNCYYI